MGFVSLIIGLTLVISTTRTEILDRAEDFAVVIWFADSANTIAWDSMYTLYGCSQHLTSDWEAGKTYQGMAYSYGGNDDTLDYLQKLKEDSLGAGNHMCHYLNYGAATGIYPPDWTAGIDCSAFVCRCWGVARTNCTGIYESYYAVDKSQVQPGDVLVWPGHHVVLIADPGPDPPSGFLALFEASGSACRVWYNPDASWSSYSSYSARSLFKPVDDDTIPTDTTDGDLKWLPVIARNEVILQFPHTSNTGDIGFHIYTVTGEMVFKGEIGPPDYEISWQGVDNYGRQLGSGVYYVRVIYPYATTPLRLLLLR